MSLVGGYLEGEPEWKVAFLGCFRPIPFRAPPDFANVTTNYTYSEPTRNGQNREKTADWVCHRLSLLMRRSERGRVVL